MPDPLLNEDLGTIEQQNSGASAYQAPLEDPIRKGEMNLYRQLPEGGSPHLNRTARQVGGAIGGVVSQARKLPDTARRGLHLVKNRAQEVSARTGEQVSGSASSLASAAQERLRDLGEAARGTGERVQQRAGEWMDLAEERGRALLDKADELTSFVADRTAELRERLDCRSRELRDEARARVEELRVNAQTTIRRYPLQTLGCIAGAAFLVGISLRIVRSRNASRY